MIKKIKNAKLETNPAFRPNSSGGWWCSVVVVAVCDFFLYLYAVSLHRLL